jgi:hypothetical protein
LKGAQNINIMALLFSTLEQRYNHAKRARLAFKYYPVSPRIRGVFYQSINNTACSGDQRLCFTVFVI